MYIVESIFFAGLPFLFRIWIIYDLVLYIAVTESQIAVGTVCFWCKSLIDPPCKKVSSAFLAIYCGST